MKYEVIDYVNGDMFNKGFNTKEEAIEEADRQWNRLSERDKERRQSFFVVKCKNPDEDAVDHFDGDIIKDYK